MAITPLPSPAPSRTMAQAAFDVATDALITALPTFVTESNALAAGMNAISSGAAISIIYTFSSAITDSDPGPGVLRLSSATQNTSTIIRADLLGVDTTSWDAVLATFDASTNPVKGHIMLAKVTDATKWILFTVSAVQSPAGYKNITVAVVGSSAVNPFVAGDQVSLKYSRAGDKGEAGISIPLNPIAAPNVITDALSAQPGTTVIGETYLVGATATGVTWAGKEGHLMQATDTTGTVWADVLGRAVIAGDRFGLAFEHGTVAGNFVGKTTQIAQVVVPTPGSYTYTFTVPAAANIVLVNGVNATDIGHGYMFSGVTFLWVEIVLPGQGITQSNADLRYILISNAFTQLHTAFTTGGTATAYTLTPSTAISANAANLRFCVKLHTTPGVSPTLSVSGKAALNLKYYDSTGVKQFIHAAVTPVNWISDIIEDGTDWVMVNVLTTNPIFSGTQKAIFGYGLAAASTSLTNLVSNTGIVGTDVTGVGTARYLLAVAGYGVDKALFGYGSTGANVSMTNLVSNTGVVGTDITGVGTARNSLAAAGYGVDKALFGYGYTTLTVSMANLVSNTGVVGADVTGVGTARYALAAVGFSLT